MRTKIIASIVGIGLAGVLPSLTIPGPGQPVGDEPSAYCRVIVVTIGHQSYKGTVEYHDSQSLTVGKRQAVRGLAGSAYKGTVSVASC